MKRKIIGFCLIMMTFCLAGCAIRHGNQPEDNDITAGVETIEVIEPVENDDTDEDDEELTLAINPDENEDTEDSEDTGDEDLFEDYDEYYYDPYVAYEDGSVDLFTDTDQIINSADFVSSEQYVRIINDFVGDKAESGMYDIARSVPVYAEGDFDLNVTKDITLPEEVDGAKIEWTSSDENVISNEGVIVKRPHDHSRYVMLTAVITKGEAELTSRYIVKVARDMYDDVTEDMIMGLSLDYGNYELLEEKGITLSDYPGWFYWCDELEQLYFFQDDLDRILLFDDPDNEIDPNVSGVGNLFEVKVETLHEAYLAACSLRSVVYCDEKYELRFERFFTGMGADYYDFVQYYNGVPTTGKIRLGIDHEGVNNSFNSWIIQIPDGFNTKPRYTKDNLNKDFELYDEPELMITVIDEEIVLVWNGNTNDGMHIIVDAMTGELLSEAPLTIID